MRKRKKKSKEKKRNLPTYIYYIAVHCILFKGTSHGTYFGLSKSDFEIIIPKIYIHTHVKTQHYRSTYYPKVCPTFPLPINYLHQSTNQTSTTRAVWYKWLNKIGLGNLNMWPSVSTFLVHLTESVAILQHHLQQLGK